MPLPVSRCRNKKIKYIKSICLRFGSERGILIRDRHAYTHSDGPTTYGAQQEKANEFVELNGNTS